MSKRRNARELVLKVLFQVDVGGLPTEEALETAFEQVRPPDEEQAYVADVVRGVAERIQDLDGIIGSLAEGWRLDRLAKVDKNVLRAALFELKHRTDIPVNVVVNDAVEIAKKYSTEDSGRFVNGILGSFLRNRGSAVPPDGPAETENETGAR
jgi:transcription antitermination protein NusB